MVHYGRLVRMGRYLWPYKHYVVLIMLSGLFFGLVNALLAGLVGFTTKIVGWSPDKGDILSLIPDKIKQYSWLQEWLLAHKEWLTQNHLFATALAIFTILLLLLSLAVFLQNYLPEWLGQRITVDMRNNLGQHLLGMDFSFFQETRSGEILSRLTNDLQQLTYAMLQIGVLFTRPATLLVLTIFIFYCDWKLALCGLIGAPVAGTLLPLLFRKIREISRQTQQQAAEVTDTMVQFLSGISTVKAYGCEAFEMENFRRENESFFRWAARCAFANTIERPITSLTAKIGVLLVLYVGGKMVMGGSVQVDTMITFLATLSFMLTPSKDLTRAQSNFQVYLAGADRVFDLLETDAKIIEGARELAQFEKSITFENVNFHYVPDAPVIRNFNLELKRGETVALVGPSGSGKSTLVHLLLRLYEITGGAIKIDGVDIRDLTFQSLRGKIALVSQNPFLFNCSISDNIAYGRADATREKIEAAARVANIHEDILALPNGYDTLVGDRGESLSGGQRQRIAIARAIFKDPPILLLDEATSALDSENERKVQDALEHIQKNRTSIVIAHRLSTIRNANRIILLEQGEIRAIGSHEELLQTCPAYANLVHLQQR